MFIFFRHNLYYLSYHLSLIFYLYVLSWIAFRSYTMAFSWSWSVQIFTWETVITLKSISKYIIII
jgi:hypothetical protein